MKKGFQTIVAIILTAFFTASCNKTEAPAPDRCGAELSQTVSMDKDFHFVFTEAEWTENNILVQEDGHRRIFMLKQAGSGICPDERIGLTYKVYTGNAFSATVPVKIDAKANWSEGGYKTITIATENQGNMKRDFLYQGNLSADLKPAFGTKAASIQSVLCLSYYSLGDVGLDTAYFKAMFTDISLSMNCKYYKD